MSSEYIGLAVNPDPDGMTPDTFRATFTRRPDVPRTPKKLLPPTGGLSDEFLGELYKDTMTGGETV